MSLEDVSSSLSIYRTGVPMERSSRGSFVLVQNHANPVGASRYTCLIQYNGGWSGMRFRTVNVVIDETLAGVKLASGLSTDEELQFVRDLHESPRMRADIPHPRLRQQCLLRCSRRHRRVPRSGEDRRSSGRCIEAHQPMVLSLISGAECLCWVSTHPRWCRWPCE